MDSNSFNIKKDSKTMAKKYYCVKVGRKTGLFTDVFEYQAAIRGYPGFIARGFNSIDAANDYLRDVKVNNDKNREIIVTNNIIDITTARKATCNNIGKTITAYIDGSYHEETKQGSYAIVIKGHKRRELCFNGIAKVCIGDKMSNIAAEIIAATEAIKFAYANGCRKITIIYDCAAVKTVIDGGKPKYKYAKEWLEAYRLISKTVLISFQKVTSHSSNSVVHQRYNNLADTAARSALSLKTKKTLQEHINHIIINWGG